MRVSLLYSLFCLTSQELAELVDTSAPSPLPQPWDGLSMHAIAALLFWVERKIKSKIPDAEFGTILSWLSMYCTPTLFFPSTPP